MFQNVTQSYDLTDATWEILVMLAVAFLLGYLFRRYLDNRLCTCCVVDDADDTEKVVASAVAEEMPVGVERDDLTIVEGIGPKIAELLRADGITTWAELADADTARLRRVLGAAGERFAMHDPSTWADQAALARDGRWTELTEFQNTLEAGKHA